MTTTNVSGDPFRIVILGDFSGQGGRRPAESAAEISSRRALRVDRDEVDAAIARIAPELHLVLDPGLPPLVVRFAELDDFHPDRLVERLPMFRELLALREAATSGGTHVQASRQPPLRPEASAGAMAEGSLLDVILADAASEVPVRSTPPGDELTRFISQAVTPHILPRASAEQADLIARIDAVMEATMRALLHHPHFQLLEALWRSTDFFLRRLETDDRLQIYIIDLSAAELAADLSAPSDGRGHAIRKLLDGQANETAGGAWSLIVANYTYGPGDIELLSRIATLGRSVGAPVIAGAHSLLAGATSLASHPDPDDWDSPLPAGWEDLRRSDDAVWIALALPRLFLRLPYDKASNSCTPVPFDEIVDARAPHESYLWGNGAMACALIVAQGVAGGGSPATHGTIERLPLHVAVVDGEAIQVPCAEAFLTQRAIGRILDRGLTPLASMRDGDVVRAPRIQSIAAPSRALAFSVSRPR